MAYEEFLDYVRQFLVAEEAPYTHVMGDERYNIPNREIKTFHTKAQAATSRKSIREKVPELTPVFFVLSAPADEEAMSLETVSTISRVGLGAILAVEHQGDIKDCIVLRSPTYSTADGDVESVMFLYPRLLVWKDKEFRGVSILQYIRNQVVTEFTHINRNTGLVTWNIARVMQSKTPDVVPLYGSAPRSGGLTRRFFRAFDETEEELELESVFDQRERTLSACYMYSLNRLSKRTDEVAELPPAMKRLKELLQMLGSNRRENRWDAAAVAQAVYDTSSGSPEGQALLEEFMEDNDRAQQLWYETTTAPKRYTSVTLRYMASRDNPGLFKKLVDAEIRPILWKSTGPHGSDLDIANILKSLYRHLFVCDAEGEWYVYNNTHWEKDGDVGLREKMREELLPTYEKLYDTITPMQGANASETKGYKERANKCSKII